MKFDEPNGTEGFHPVFSTQHNKEKSMSWSVSALGKAPAVAAKIDAQIGAIRCVEPEETIKGRVREALAIALGAFPDGQVVKVEASGSQGTATDGKVTNNLSVKIEPQWGFVE